jgi:hypothetical protein
MVRLRNDHPRFRQSEILVVLIFTLFAGAGQAADTAASDSFSNKVTASYYSFSSGKEGVDLNLRHTFGPSTAWIGGYRESSGFDQARAGYQYNFSHDWLTLVPSAQAATRGFLGATLYAEAGKTLFAIGGAGRTNLHPYWNLGFDPNDFIQAGVGYRDHSGNTMSVFAIRDDRLHTGQTNTHLYFRRYLPDKWRVTLDVVNEHGHGDEGVLVNAWAASMDVDWRRWFVRVARDPHVNYTPDRQVRVSGGLRF